MLRLTFLLILTLSIGSQSSGRSACEIAQGTRCCTLSTGVQCCGFSSSPTGSISGCDCPDLNQS